MTKTVLALAMAAGLCGCAGVSITPITKAKVENAHQGGTDIKGYIVYAPMTVLEVSEKVICLKTAQDKSCTVPKVICGVGTPFVLPDLTKPYVVEVQSGFGKAGVDIGLKDGWLISHIKDTSDNTALLGFIEKVVLTELKKGAIEPPSTEGCQIAGLYQVNPTATGVELKELKLYPKPAAAPTTQQLPPPSRTQ